MLGLGLSLTDVAVLRRGGAVAPVAPKKLDFSKSTNSQYLPVLGA